MIRITSRLACILGVSLALLIPAGMEAATKKKHHSPTSDDDASTPAPKKNEATPPLNLPLPSKSTPKPGGEAGAEKKAGTGESATTPKPAEKADKGGEKPAEKATEKNGSEAKAKGEHAPNATVEPETISEFAAQPPRIQQLMRDALDLTRLNLTYTFGSADPDSGGMDCSGTIYYLLHAHDFKDAPRDSSGQYLWARRGGFFPVLSKSAESVEFKELLPGDLMFWIGTYENGRDIPVSHVMMYLGREKGSGKRIMFGASDGRSYNGIQRWGVSVFDFKMPKADPGNPEKAKVEFVGYARIPGLRGPAPAPLAGEQDAAESSKKTTSSSTAAPSTPKSSSGTKSSRKKKKPSSE